MLSLWNKYFCLNQKGSSQLVEVAFVFPVIMMLLFGTIHVTNMIRESVVIQSAARSAARDYAVNEDYSTAGAIARRDVSMGRVTASNVSYNIEDGFVTVQARRNLNLPLMRKTNVRSVADANFYEEIEYKFYGELEGRYPRRPRSFRN